MTPSRPSRSPVRTDIEGLRAIAVGLVVIYHLSPDRLHGGFVGVDVFFVISGFLITTHLIKRPPESWSDLGHFWARRARRLLPAAAVVLIAIVVAFRFLGTETQWKSTALDSLAATFYAANWRFAAEAVDYLGAESAPSPVQHFWSLSVEEQFYLVWPFLVVLAFFITKKRRSTWNVASFRWVALAVTVLSLAYGIYLTETNSAAAYFVTPTRMWELALGGLVATFVPLSATKAGSAAAQVTGWVGLGMLLAAGVFYNASMPFPGYVALLPVVGSALVIYSAVSPSSALGRLLGNKPAVWVGGLSYSLYLWHWPIIVLVDSRMNTRPWWFSLILLLLSLCLAWLSKKFVEDPLRRYKGQRPFRYSYGLAIVCMASVAVVGSFQVTEVNSRQKQQEQKIANVQKSACFGAATLAHPEKCEDGLDTPISPAAAADDLPAFYGDDCLSSMPFDLKTCTYGDGDIKIAVVGNSHAGQWVNPLAQLAEKNDWTVTTYLASGCTGNETLLNYRDKGRAEACRDWGKKAREATSGHRYDLVITTNRNTVAARGKRISTSYTAWKAGYKSYLNKWATSGTPVLVLHDTPFPGSDPKVDDIPKCLETHKKDPSKCSGPASKWIPEDPLYAASKEVSGVRQASLNDRICNSKTCQPIVGQVPVYFDTSHMTKTYTSSLAPYLLPIVENSLSAYGTK